MVANLFFVRGRQIAVFSFCDKKLTSFLKDSCLFFDIKEDFWDWWRVRTQYKNGEEKDLCFVWDKKDSCIFESDFFCSKLEKSLWDRKKIELVLEKIGFSAYIQDEEGEVIGDTNGVKFLTNVNLREETEMYRYYRELNEKREEERQSFMPTKRGEVKLCEAKVKRRIQGDATTENKEINQ